MITVNLIRNDKVLVKTVIVGYRKVVNFDNSKEESKFFKQWVKDNSK